MIPIKAMPPITPPTIMPVFDLAEFESGGMVGGYLEDDVDADVVVEVNVIIETPGLVWYNDTPV